MSIGKVHHSAERLISTVLLESKRLQKAGKLIEALEELEKVLPETEASKIPSYQKVVLRIATLCNRLATDPSKPKVKYLRTAEQVLLGVTVKGEALPVDETCFRLMLLTWNNWATYHKEKRSYHMALNYLMQALKMIEKVGEISNPDTLELCAKTKLNIAALYSELRRYPEAVEFSEQSLATLQLELNLRLSGTKLENFTEKERLKFNNMICTYVIALYNIGVSEEALGAGMNSVEAYRNAVNIGKRFLPDSNPVLIMAEEALNDAPQYISTQTDRNPLPKPVKSAAPATRQPEPNHEIELPALGQSISSPLLSQLSSNNLSEIHISDSKPIVTEEKMRDDELKYYTTEQLVKLQQKMARGTGLNFVSADKYFYTKITKTLNVSQDVKFLRPLSAAASSNAWHRDDEERRLVSGLRLRKHPHKQTAATNRGKEYVVQHITRMNEEMSAASKKSEIRMKSKMRNKEFRSAAQRMALASESSASKPKPQYPPQRTFQPGLFFKGEPGSPKATFPALDTEKSLSQAKTQDFKVVKEEIETRMDELNEDLKRIDVLQTTSSLLGMRRSSAGDSDRVKLACDLAKSAQKIADNRENHPKKLKINVTEEDVKRLSDVLDRKRLAQIKAPVKKQNPFQVQYPFTFKVRCR